MLMIKMLSYMYTSELREKNTFEHMKFVNEWIVYAHFLVRVESFFSILQSTFGIAVIYIYYF